MGQSCPTEALRLLMPSSGVALSPPRPSARAFGAVLPTLFAAVVLDREMLVKRSDRRAAISRVTGAPVSRHAMGSGRSGRWTWGIDAAAVIGVAACLAACDGGVVYETSTTGSTETTASGGAPASTSTGTGNSGGAEGGTGGTGGLTGGTVTGGTGGTTEPGCLLDSDCPGGSICIQGQCIPGCSPDQACAAGLSCCGGTCFDLATDVDNCGACGGVCILYPHSLSPTCLNGQCLFTGCEAGWDDCDADPSNGCEQNELADGTCLCSSGDVQPCYLGVPGTEGVGPCHAGTRTCDASGTGWSACAGQVLPAAEQCNNGVDDDCDGLVDVATDIDGDGFTACEGDCDDFNPNVNPGAFEDTYGVDPQSGATVEGIGNGIDDDCNPATPDVGIVTCDDGEILSNVTALGLARAMDLCQTALAGVPKAQQTWGLLSAELLRADGTTPSAAQMAALQDLQTATLAAYGVVTPLRGSTMAGLSTGKMRAPSHADHVPPAPGTDLGWADSPPASYLQAHNGELPLSAGCNGVCPAGGLANDGVSLRLVVRTPTNAYGFSFRHQFLTAEYPASVCAGKDDFFLALETSGSAFVPLDRNVALDGLGVHVSVDNAFFQSCEPSGCFLCPLGVGGLGGTGMLASTDWLAANGPILIGETITLDLTVFDVSDGTGDSVVLLDGFRWLPYKDSHPCGAHITTSSTDGLPPEAIGTKPHCVIQ